MPDAVLTPQERPASSATASGSGIATGAYGASFGAVSVASGLSVAQTCALSLVMFTGASQFALVGVLAAGGAPVSGALTALLLGTRNTLYGLRLAPLLAWTRLAPDRAAHLLIDESTAMAVTRTSVQAARVGFLTTGTLDLPAVEPRHPRRRGRRNSAGRPAHLRSRRRGGRGVPRAAVAAAA